MPAVEGALRNRLIWHYIEEARRPPPPPPPRQITISGATASTNGTFVIDSISTSASFATNSIYVSPTGRRYPKFYGGTLDPETGRLYDARLPSGERAIQPESLRKRREKAKAARKARKRSRR